MVDVAGDNGAAGGDFLTNELRGDFFRNIGTKVLATVLFVKNRVAHCCALGVLADSDKFHFGGDNALARIVQLRNIFAGFGAARFGQFLETQMIKPFISHALLAVHGGQRV